MKVIILTGSETRHNFFRIKFGSDKRFKVLASYCEGNQKSLANRTKESSESSKLEFQHVDARSQSEKDFFQLFLKNTIDHSEPKFIQKGSINNKEIVKEIINLNPDVLVCYGSSLIKSELIDIYKGRFLNVHLGLSPYYRGSGTNVWPLINKEPEMVGATFMYIDPGIDTGAIIHQIRADIFLGDGPHSIGNRLIRKMTSTYADIIANFDNLSQEDEISIEGRLYFQKDFNSYACLKLYKNFQNGMIEKYLNSQKDLPYIIKNKGLRK